MIALLGFVMLMGCTKEPMTTYTVVFTDIVKGLMDLGDEYGFNNTSCDLVVSEYYEGQRVDAKMEKGVRDGKDYRYIAHSKCEYITVRLDANFANNPRLDDVEITNYIAHVIYLNIGEDTRVEFGNDTLVSKYEPQ